MRALLRTALGIAPWNLCNSCSSMVDLSLPRYRTAPQQMTHISDDERIQDQRGELDRRKAVAELVELDRDIDAAAHRGDPFAPAALEPQAVGFGESQRSIGHRECGESPKLGIGGVGGEIEKDARKFLRRIEVQAIDQVFRRLLQ